MNGAHGDAYDYRTGPRQVQQRGLHVSHGDGEVRFQSLPTKIAALRELFERERPDLVVFEACAQAGFTADLCRELGLKFLVANTNGEAWKWKNVKRKTDRDDALKLARLAYLGELPTVELPETAPANAARF